MCYYSRLTKKAIELENRFKAKFETPELYKTSKQFNGFARPFTPIISDSKKGFIEMGQWGLIPYWNKENKMTYNTLNARIENLDSSKLWSKFKDNRCLIIADGYYEWQWADPENKKSNKTKYLLTYPENEIFAMAGLYADWKDTNGKETRTYSIVMTEADELLSRIHNSAKRMPVVLKKDQEQSWLNGDAYLRFQYPEIALMANIAEPQGRLFS